MALIGANLEPLCAIAFGVIQIEAHTTQFDTPFRTLATKRTGAGAILDHGGCG